MHSSATPASSSGSSSTSAVTVTSTDGTFTTVIPEGFGSGAGSPQSRSPNILYVAIVPFTGSVANFKADILVTHYPLVRSAQHHYSEREMLATARAGVVVIRRNQPGTYAYSRVRPLKVAGEEAASYDFLARGPPQLHFRTVTFAHGAWVYSVGYRAVPSVYATYFGGVAEVIKGWRWR